jgi:hypothetical protein
LIAAKVVKNFAYIKLIIYRENGSFLIVIQKENFSIFDKKIEKMQIICIEEVVLCSFLKDF